MSNLWRWRWISWFKEWIWLQKQGEDWSSSIVETTLLPHLKVGWIILESQHQQKWVFLSFWLRNSCSYLRSRGWFNLTSMSLSFPIHGSREANPSYVIFWFFKDCSIRSDGSQEKSSYVRIWVHCQIYKVIIISIRTFDISWRELTNIAILWWGSTLEDEATKASEGKKNVPLAFLDHIHGQDMKYIGIIDLEIGMKMSHGVQDRGITSDGVIKFEVQVLLGAINFSDFLTSHCWMVGKLCSKFVFIIKQLVIF